MALIEKFKPRAPRAKPTPAQAQAKAQARTQRKLQAAKARRKAWQIELKALRRGEETRRYAREAKQAGMSEAQVRELAALLDVEGTGG